MSTTFTAEQIEESIAEALVQFGTDADVIAPDAPLESLDIDSLDLAELAQIVEEKFGVVLTGNDIKEITTIGDLVAVIAARA
jgi:acyl carrier protein